MYVRGCRFLSSIGLHEVCRLVCYQWYAIPPGLTDHLAF
jgi:hypothetical protein